MEAAMMEGNNAYMKYMQTHKHTKVSDGTVSIDQLPLIKVEPKSKKVLQGVLSGHPQCV